MRAVPASDPSAEVLRVVAVSDDLGALRRPLGWLAEADYAVRAVVGPGSIAWCCRMVDLGMPLLHDGDLVVVSQHPALPENRPREEDLVRTVRARVPELPVIVVRGDADHETVALALQVGALVTRPVRRDVLRAVRAAARSAVGD